MSILLIGDPHFRVSSIQECQVMARKIVEYAGEKRPSMIVVLGDVLDRHETIHVEPLTHASKFLQDLSLIAETFVLIGNHDRPNNSDFLSNRHPFQLAESDTLHIVWTTIRDGNYVFVPYVPPGRFVEALDKVVDMKGNPAEWRDAKLIFAHQEFKGCKMGAIVSEVGDEWSSSLPKVYSGHIHDYQELGNVIYVGTPMAHAFGDNEDKSVSWIDSKGVHTRVYLDLPVKKLMNISSTDAINIDPDEYDLPEGTLLKIVVAGSHAENTVASKSDGIKQLQKKGVKVVFRDVQGDTVKDVKVEHRMFRQLLQDAVSKDKEMKALFRELFGAETK